MVKVKGKDGIYEIENGEIKWHSDKPKRVRGFEPVKNAPVDTILPIRGSNEAAGYDFFAPEGITIEKGFSPVIWLNVKAYMQKGEYLRMENRSGFMAKKNVMLFCSCIIDADYYSNFDNDGNIAIRFLNFGEPFAISKGERICQGIFLPCLEADNTESLGTRVGGFGSTGK